VPKVRLGGEDLHKKKRKQSCHRQVNLLFNLSSSLTLSDNKQNCPYQQESKEEDNPTRGKIKQEIHTHKPEA